MTSPVDPEEDNSNLVSSSGSSPVLFTDPEAEVLQVLPSKATSEIRSKRWIRIFDFFKDCSHLTIFLMIARFFNEILPPNWKEKTRQITTNENLRKFCKCCHQEWRQKFDPKIEHEFLNFDYLNTFKVEVACCVCRPGIGVKVTQRLEVFKPDFFH